MEAYAFYLIKSIAWLTGFAVIYFVFLRNERFFTLKRYYLIAGIILSLALPLFSFHYRIEIPAGSPASHDFPTFQADQALQSVTGNLTKDKPERVISRYAVYIFMIYITGLIFLIFRLARNARVIYNTISSAKIKTLDRIRLVRVSELPGSFSFFNYVFINPTMKENELEIIMNHELVHVDQKHWLDLCLVEMIRLLQWINPFAWVYIRLMKQNHEYIADQVALQRVPDQAAYRAVLVNQLFGSRIFSLTNSFSYSITKRRFEMMKKIDFSPYRKMKIFLVVPVIAILFYAFAEPEYHYVSASDNVFSIARQEALITKESDRSSENLAAAVREDLKENQVRGSIVRQDGKPLHGAAIIVKGTTTGTTSDVNGYFDLKNIPEGSSLVISFVGFRTRIIEPDFKTEMRITLIDEVFNLDDMKITDSEGREPHPLIVLDGVVTDKKIRDIDSWTIYSISVLKDQAATDKYGEKGMNGVLEITTKKDQISGERTISAGNIEISSSYGGKEESPYVIVEAMPEFPGGRENLRLWLSQNMKYPEEAKINKIAGRVYVTFVVNSTGKVLDAKVAVPVNPLLDAEAIRLIKIMPDWKPGSQMGRPVDVRFSLPVEFSLNDN